MAERTDKSARKTFGGKKPAGRKSREKAASAPSVGERLRAERTKREMSLKDAARELHLDHWLLEALERDDYDALGAPVFAKGHLRKYAALLDLPGDEIMIAYYQAERVADAPPIVSESLIRARSERPGRWLRVAGIAVLVALGAAGAVWWFVSDEPDPLRAVGEDVTPAPVAEPTETAPADTEAAGDGSSTVALAVPPPADDADAGPEQTSASTTAEQLSSTTPVVTSAPSSPSNGDSAAGSTTEDVVAVEPEAAPAPAPAVAEPPASTAGSLRVALTFNDDSWVEINDGNGRRLLYGMGNRGTTRTVTGEPPIQVFLGRARGVRVSVDGEPYAIPAAGLRGNTARFRIGAER